MSTLVAIAFPDRETAATGAGAVGGAAWGGLIGLIFLAPLVGSGRVKWARRSRHRSIRRLPLQAR